MHCCVFHGSDKMYKTQNFVKKRGYVAHSFEGWKSKIGWHYLYCLWLGTPLIVSQNDKWYYVGNIS